MFFDKIFKFLRREKKWEIDFERGESEYLNTLMVLYDHNENCFTFHYEDKFSIPEVYEFLDSAMYSLELHLDESFEHSPKKNIKPEPSLKLVKGEQNQNK